MPDLQNAYITVAELRTALGDNGTNLQSDLLVLAANSASRAVDAWTGRRFWMDDTPSTQVFEPVDAYDLWLADDIASTTGLVIATDDNGNGAYDAAPWDVLDYQLWPYRANNAGSLYGAWWKLESLRGKRFNLPNIAGRHGLAPVRITARFGWSFVPDPVKQATLLKALQLFKRKDAPFGVAQFGDIAAVRITRADADVLELLWPYVRDMAMVG